MEKISLITILIFFGLLLFFSLFFKKFYFKNLEFNKKYKQISSGKYFSLLLSFFIILASIFWFNFWDEQIKNNDKWIDMMFVLDVSKSMNAYDIKDWWNLYSRLDIAKKSIADFVTSHKSDRFWLVIFAWDAISTIPLTSDHDIFLTFLDWVDYKNLVKQWSDFEKALNLWVERFNYSDRSKALIFVSDWWDPEDSVNYSSIKKIVKKVDWIKYFVVWVWSNSWWKIISWQDFFWRNIYQKYKWQDVVVKINEQNLKEISNAVDWKYLKVSEVGDLWDLNDDIQKLEKKSLNESGFWDKKDASRILAFVSFSFFLLFLFLQFFEDKIYNLKRKND